MQSLIILTTIALFTACQNMPAAEQRSNADSVSASTRSDSNMYATPLPIAADTTTLNGRWYLEPVLPSDTGAGRHPELDISLSKKTFTGNTGCNRMSGSFKQTDSTLTFNENIITTKMACTGYNESAFIKSLLRTNRYRFDNGTLILMVDATELSRWTRKLEKPSKINKT